MSNEDQDSKQHDASQEKLARARREGDIPRSVELTTAAVYGSFALTIMFYGQSSALMASQFLVNILRNAGDASRAPAHAEMGSLDFIIGSTTMIFGPYFLSTFAVVVLLIIAQRGFIFTPTKISPKLSRISVLANFKNKFGRGGLIEFAKSCVKVGIYCCGAWLFFKHHAEAVTYSGILHVGASIQLMFDLLVWICILMALVSVVIGVIDLIWQHASFRMKNKMSRQEVMDEHRDSEGDPHTKAQRRQRAVDIATNQMLANLPTANVVIVNPTHYAVALKWSRGSSSAPVCVAKGMDEVAARIRERAIIAGIPLHSDPPTARALFATVNIGQEIKADHYRAVAAAIRFAESMRGRKK